jgi:hypothetical protein
VPCGASLRFDPLPKNPCPRALPPLMALGLRLLSGGRSRRFWPCERAVNALRDFSGTLRALSGTLVPFCSLSGIGASSGGLQESPAALDFFGRSGGI